MDRIVFHLVHTNADASWHLTEDGRNALSSDSKEAVLQHGRMLCRAHHAQGDNAQLVVHRADGSIETEYTYGEDPRSSPG